MPDNLVVGVPTLYETVWFDGPNGTGNIVTDTAPTVYVSDNMNALQTQPGTGPQNVNLLGVNVGTANLTATSSNGVVSGFLDVNGVFQPGPEPFNVIAAAIAILSGITRKVAAAASAAVKK